MNSAFGSLPAAVLRSATSFGCFLAQDLLPGFPSFPAGFREHFLLPLFAVPVIVLEPAKPVSGYLIGTGHFFAGAVIFIAAEVVKLTVVERLFQLNKDKLLSIPAFAWGYRYWRAMMEIVESLEVWKAARRVTVQVGKVWRVVFHRSRDARSEPRAHGTRIVRSRVS